MPRPSIWEGKTAFSAEEWGEPGTDEIPVYYRCQVLWYLDVFGLAHCYLSVLIGGIDYREYLIEYDAQEAAFLREHGAAFLASVHNGVRPDIDAHDATYRAIRERHPDIDGETVSIPADIADLWLSAEADADAAKERSIVAKSELLEAMGEAQKATHALTGEVIARRQRHGRGGVALYRVKPTRARKRKVTD